MTDERLGREVRRLSEELSTIRSRQAMCIALVKGLNDEERALEERGWVVKNALRKLTGEYVDLSVEAPIRRPLIDRPQA